MRVPNFSQFINCLIFNSKNYSSLLLCFFFLFLSGLSSSIYAQEIEVVNFSTNGTYTILSETSVIKVEAWGGGGAGGDAGGLLSATRGGGGGGGAYYSGFFSVSAGQQYSVTVGQGAIISGDPGAASLVKLISSGATILTANGGSGGENTGALAILGNNNGAGGAGGIGIYNGGAGGAGIALSSVAGAGGGGAGNTGNGGAGSGSTGGAGGSGTIGGGSGANSVSGNSDGANGSPRGGGGSGGRAAGLLVYSSGGHGGNGYVRITAYRCYSGYTTTWTGTWDNGIPSKEKTAIINANYNTATNGSITACSCQINSGKTLTIATANQLEIYNEISNSGTVIVESNASFLQHYSTTTNTGSIHVLRNANPMKRYDFTYWSSPVASQTLFNLSPTTLSDKYYSYNPSSGWVTEYNGAATMGIGMGYAVRAPQSFPINTTANFTGTFQGAPHNGDQTVAVFQGSSTTDVWNLIGNPYPSAIDIDLFLADPDNLEVGGTVYLWTHNTPPIANGSGQYTYTSHDYASYNLSGGVATAATNDPNDPTEGDDNDNTLVNGQIASGQAFFIKGTANGAGTVKFKNSMRISGSNTNFFKPGPTTPVENWEMTGKHRFWVNLTNAQGAFNQALIGYVENATNELDRLYDGKVFGGNYVTIYSLLEQDKLTIQGRSLPFNNQDVVPLGYKVTIAGTFDISLDHFDGIFEGQDVFLKDNLLNVIHDLKDSAYSFTSAIGTFDSRFEIVYVNEPLGIENPEINPESVIVYKNTNSDIVVNAGLLTLDQVKVYDIAGRLLSHAKNMNTTETFIKNLPATQQVLIVDVLTEEGYTITKKIIF